MGWGRGWGGGSGGGGGGGGGDTTPPQVFNFVPVSGTSIVPTDAIEFSVADETSFRRVLVWAVFPSGDAEVIHDGDQFMGSYRTYSTRTDATFGPLTGWTYVVRRYGGWPGSPRIVVDPIDRGGNEASA